jgi:hypothetical protein
MPKSSRRNFKKYSKKRIYRNSRNTKYRNNKKQTLKKKKRRKTKMKGGSNWNLIKDKINRTNFYDVVNQAYEFNFNKTSILELKLANNTILNFIKNNEYPKLTLNHIIKRNIPYPYKDNKNNFFPFNKKLKEILGDTLYLDIDKKKMVNVHALDSEVPPEDFYIITNHLSPLKLSKSLPEEIFYEKLSKLLFFHLLLYNKQEGKLYNIQCIDIFYPIIEIDALNVNDFKTEISTLVQKYSSLNISSSSDLSLKDLLVHFIGKLSFDEVSKNDFKISEGTKICDIYEKKIVINISDGTIKCDKITDYISYLNDKIITCKNLKKKFVICRIRLLIEGVGHANYLIFDTKNNVCCRIEPHGYTSDTSIYDHVGLNTYIKDNIIDKLSNLNFVYTNINHDKLNTDEQKKILNVILESFTGAQTATQGLSETGMCNVWSLYLTILYILYPKYTMDTINKLVLLDNPHLRILKFIYRIKLFEESIKISNPQRHKFNYIEESKQEEMIKYEMFDLREKYPPNSFI